MLRNAQPTTELHSSHILAKYCSKFSNPGSSSTCTVNVQMFKLDLENAEEPEIKLSTSVGSSKKGAFQKNVYFYFIDYAKAFDFVNCSQLRKILQEIWIPYHLTCLLRNLYECQETTLRTGHGTTDWFQIGKGVRQGCILSPAYLKYMQRTSWEKLG